LRKEEDLAERGIIQKNAAGLLPIEMEMQAKREPLDMQDLRLSIGIRDNYLFSVQHLPEQIMLNQFPNLDSSTPIKSNGLFGMTNGVKNHDPHHRPSSSATALPDAMDIDDNNNINETGARYDGFRGVSKFDHDSLMGSLDECLLAAPG